MTIPFASVFPFPGIDPWEKLSDGNRLMYKNGYQKSYISEETRNHLRVPAWGVPYADLAAGLMAWEEADHRQYTQKGRIWNCVHNKTQFAFRNALGRKRWKEIAKMQ